MNSIKIKKIKILITVQNILYVRNTEHFYYIKPYSHINEKYTFKAAEMQKSKNEKKPKTDLAIKGLMNGLHWVLLIKNFYR